MTTKFISLATAIVLLDVYLRSQLASNDPLFLFASSSIAVNACLMVLVGLMVAVSFKDRFRYWWTFASCAALAALLGVMGIIGVFFSDTFYYFPQILQPLDYLFFLEASIVFGICSLSYKHEPLPFKLHLPRLSQVFTSFAIPVPKIPQSPNSSTGSASHA